MLPAASSPEPSVQHAGESHGPQDAVQSRVDASALLTASPMASFELPSVWGLLSPADETHVTAGRAHHP